MKVYQYVLVYEPKPEDEKASSVAAARSATRLISEVCTILAEDEKSVLIQAGRAIPDEYIDRLTDVKILIRPF